MQMPTDIFKRGKVSAVGRLRLPLGLYRVGQYGWIIPTHPGTLIAPTTLSNNPELECGADAASEQAHRTVMYKQKQC